MVKFLRKPREYVLPITFEPEKFIPFMLTNTLIMTLRLNLLLLLCFTGLAVTAQKLKKADLSVISSLQAHISYLADDKLGGRRTGSPGEKMAMQYISSQFEKNGLLPKGENGSYSQSFTIDEGKSFEENSYLVINDEKLKPGEFFPIGASPNATIEASPSMALKETGVPWFLDVREDVAAAKDNPQFDLMTYLVDKAKDASKKGATALLVFNSDESAAPPTYDSKEKSRPATIPVIVISNNIVRKFFSDETATLVIKLKVEFTEHSRTGHNVIGLLDNRAATTIIIGAHYDHLGMGEDGSSLSRDAGNEVHNGADDNASGTAALIELAKLIKSSKLKNNNYLFIAFSGEEAGLFGSKYFVEHPTIDLSTSNYMVNLDMVGRLNDSSKVLTVGGYGTSPTWGPLFKSTGSRYFTNKYDSSGTGPSDHVSFYRKDIPVLFFFTGWHGDYHKPTDDFNKVNYTGTYRIIQYIYKLIEGANSKGKLAFTKTRETHTGAVTGFPVTLGIMPDYTFGGPGVRVDGVSEGRPAGKAGLKAGDVVVQLGSNRVNSLEDYMKALNSFKTGEKTTLVLVRAGQTIEAEILFDRVSIH